MITVQDPVVKKYLSGRIPVRVWLLSSLSGALLFVIHNLIGHDAVLQGFFSILLINVVSTFPTFAAQAHFVGLALQRNRRSAKTVLATVLIVCWALTGLVLWWAIGLLYEDGWNSGAALLVGNFATVCTFWVVMSLISTRLPARKEQ